MNTPPRLALVATGGARHEVAALARRLALPVLEPGTEVGDGGDFDALVLVGEGGLAVQRTGRGAPGPVSVDFGNPVMRHRRGAGHNELLGRAVGIGKKPALRVVDATAGLGRDGFILADLGCHVLMCEREALMGLLLESGFEHGRASGDPWLAGVLGRMELWLDDARRLSPAQVADFDVIYLDPMFPPRSKSAAVKKEMALFQLVLAERGDDADALLEWALDQDVARVVVKRPAKGGSLARKKPSHTVAGRAVRYDVYTRRALS